VARCRLTDWLAMIDQAEQAFQSSAGSPSMCFVAMLFDINWGTDHEVGSGLASIFRDLDC
jgi:hypothetical protein